MPQESPKNNPFPLPERYEIERDGQTVFVLLSAMTPREVETKIAEIEFGIATDAAHAAALRWHQATLLHQAADDVVNEAIAEHDGDPGPILEESLVRAVLARFPNDEADDIFLRTDAQKRVCEIVEGCMNEHLAVHHPLLRAMFSPGETFEKLQARYRVYRNGAAQYVLCSQVTDDEFAEIKAGLKRKSEESLQQAAELRGELRRREVSRIH